MCVRIAKKTKSKGDLFSKQELPIGKIKTQTPIKDFLVFFNFPSFNSDEIRSFIGFAFFGQPNKPLGIVIVTILWLLNECNNVW